MIQLSYVKQIADYYLAYHYKITKPLPDNLTISITRACQSACLTCDCGFDTRRGLVKVSEELSLDEWLQIIGNIDWKLAFLTISGGEPSLSRNLEAVALAFAEQTRPNFVTIPTNALRPDLVLNKIQRILDKSPSETRWHVNVSVDGIGKVHDHVRGVEGNFEKCLKTIHGLIDLRARYPNLRVGVHTVVSTHTVDTVEDTVNYFRRMPLDNQISEIAEERAELGTMGREITPYQDYARILPFLKQALGRREEGRIRRALRHSYYDLVDRWVREPKRQHVPCMAGVASCHITEKGYLTSCCVRWVQRGLLGNLRDSNYEIKRIWLTERANAVRRIIKRQECACPLASAAYSSMLMSPRTLLQIIRDYLYVSR
jgi:MoaA/NifB/PqqE/SkfB family radical SAM enzyme